MKKLIYVFLAVVLFAACTNSEIRTDVKQTTLEEVAVAEANSDNLYIVVVEGKDKITVFNPVTFEKEYEVLNNSGEVGTLLLLVFVLFFVGLIVGNVF